MPSKTTARYQVLQYWGAARADRRGASWNLIRVKGSSRSLIVYSKLLEEFQVTQSMKEKDQKKRSGPDRDADPPRWKNSACWG